MAPGEDCGGIFVDVTDDFFLRLVGSLGLPLWLVAAHD